MNEISQFSEYLKLGKNQFKLLLVCFKPCGLRYLTQALEGYKFTISHLADSFINGIYVKTN